MGGRGWKGAQVSARGGRMCRCLVRLSQLCGTFCRQCHVIELKVPNTTKTRKRLNCARQTSHINYVLRP